MNTDGLCIDVSDFASVPSFLRAPETWTIISFSTKPIDGFSHYGVIGGGGDFPTSGLHVPPQLNNF